MIIMEENKIKDLHLSIDKITLELKQKTQKAKLNSLRIKELKKKLKLLQSQESLKKNQLPLKRAEPLSRNQSCKKYNNTEHAKYFRYKVTKHLISSFNEFRRDMIEESQKTHADINEKKTPSTKKSLDSLEQVIESDESDSLNNDTSFIPNKETRSSIAQHNTIN